MNISTCSRACHWPNALSLSLIHLANVHPFVTYFDNEFEIFLKWDFSGLLCEPGHYIHRCTIASHVFIESSSGMPVMGWEGTLF